jgi:hypothetical protein
MRWAGVNCWMAASAGRLRDLGWWDEIGWICSEVVTAAPSLGGGGGKPCMCFEPRRMAVSVRRAWWLRAVG